MTAIQEPAPRGEAAFFDVDGTIARTTIVHYYVYFRRRRMAAMWRSLWQAVYMIKCGYYLVLDRIDRGRLNIIFYRSYAGLPVEEIKALVADCHEDVIRPRYFPEALDCIAEHRDAGRKIVLVTGSVDFTMGPLAEELCADELIAPSLVESQGRFTGSLTGPPVGTEEKARRIRSYAEDHAIDLSASHAYGDSIADLAMLETVGHPHAVNPDKALARIARQRGWPIHRWPVAGSNLVATS